MNLALVCPCERLAAVILPAFISVVLSRNINRTVVGPVRNVIASLRETSGDVSAASAGAELATQAKQSGNARPAGSGERALVVQ